MSCVFPSTALSAGGLPHKSYDLQPVLALAEGGLSLSLNKYLPPDSAHPPTLLSFLVTNACSPLPKIEELSSLVMKVKRSLVFVTETWLNDGVPSSLLELP